MNQELTLIYLKLVSSLTCKNIPWSCGIQVPNSVLLGNTFSFLVRQQSHCMKNRVAIHFLSTHIPQIPFSQIHMLHFHHVLLAKHYFYKETPREVHFLTIFQAIKLSQINLCKSCIFIALL